MKSDDGANDGAARKAKSAWIDYSHEVREIQSPLVRYTLQGIAFLSLGLGIAGIFLPLLPATPFLLLASACYARSSARFYNYLMNHARLGPPLRRWKEQRAIAREHKIAALALMAITMIPTILFLVPVLAVKILLVVIGLTVATFIATRPDLKENARRSNPGHPDDGSSC